MLLHGHKITALLQPSHSHSRQNREEGAVPISPHLTPVPFIKKGNFPKFLADFKPPWTEQGYVATPSSRQCQEHKYLTSTSIVGKKEVPECLLGQPVKCVCHFVIIVPFRSFSLILCHLTKTIKFLMAESLFNSLFTVPHPSSDHYHAKIWGTLLVAYKYL